ncbi:DUF2569 domain-containing protein [Phyllobacterium sp. SB3]|uniref:DUF2569 domain-containing protein n=1 Tax=Phyllobacterium sp. SB3 TaxID=3156073 RepID=UPI0032AF6572
MTAVENSISDGPKGIGGWMILPILGMAGTALAAGITTWQGVAGLTLDDWQNLLAAYPWFVASLALSVAFGVAGVAIIAFTLKLIFSKDARAPKWAILYFIFMVVIGTIEFGILHHYADVFQDPSMLDDEPKDTIRNYIIAAVWVPYFMRSKRVRNTFVN